MLKPLCPQNFIINQGSYQLVLFVSKIAVVALMHTN